MSNFLRIWMILFSATAVCRNAHRKDIYNSCGWGTMLIIQVLIAALER